MNRNVRLINRRTHHQLHFSKNEFAELLSIFRKKTNLKTRMRDMNYDSIYDSTYSVPKSFISKQKSRNYVNRRKQITSIVPSLQSPLLREVLKRKGVIDKDTECYPSSIGLRIPYREWKLYYKRTNPSKLAKDIVKPYVHFLASISTHLNQSTMDNS
jgi:hypothetical protein